MIMGSGENISTLDGLWEVAEYIINEDDGLGGIGGSSNVCLQAPNSLVFTLLLIAFGNDGRNVAAGCRVAVLGLHCERAVGIRDGLSCRREEWIWDNDEPQ